MLIPDWLPRRATDMPDRLALIAGTGPEAIHWTWSELNGRVVVLAGRLAEHGITAGDRVGVLCANGLHFVEAIHALIRRRAVLVPLNIRLAPDEIVWQIQNSGIRLLLVDASTTALAAACRLAVPSLAILPLVPPTATQAQEQPASPVTVLPSDRLDLAAVHSIVYTSGTSGRPKGALLTYGNHWWNAIGSALNLGLEVGDRWLACLPLFHVGGLSIVMRSAIYGIPMVLPDAALPGVASKPSFDAGTIDRLIDEEQVTIISVVSAMLPKMLEARGERPYPATFRCLLLGGGPAPRSLLAECAGRGIPVTQTYGLTETASQCVTLAPSDAVWKLGSAGRPLLPNEVTILPIDDGDGPLDQPGAGGPDLPGVTAAEPDRQPSATGFAAGEILVRGPSVTIGYLAEAGAAAVPAVDAEGWLHTGDIGYLDDDGFLYVLDRRTDLIVSGGENIYPAEIESVLLTHPLVAEAAVYGVPDEQWGQRVAATVVLLPGTTTAPLEEILAFCRAHLAAYKVPDRLLVADSLPRNAAGKLLRRRLRQT